MRTPLVACVLVLTSYASVPAQAVAPQTSGSTISGRVMKDGNPVAGIRVVLLTYNSIDIAMTATTGPDGRYQFTR